MQIIHRRPGIAFLAPLMFCLIACGLLLWLALQQPWLGLQFELSTSGDAVIVRPASAEDGRVQAGVYALALSGLNGDHIDLLPMDIIEEPDFYDTYEQTETFFLRQSRLDAILRSGEVRLHWQDADGQTGTSTLKPGKRHLRDLPVVFWFQLLTGLAGLLIASWVFLLRTQDWGARMFMLTGLAFPFATSTAAIYSTRELVLPEGMFRLLSTINHFGSTAFGVALIALFICYPRMLVRARYLLVLPVVFGVWFLADTFRWAPDPDLGFRIPLIVEMLTSILFAAVQWYLSRRQPLERAALRWFTLSTLLGCSLFILFVPGYSTLGLPPLISQGYSFGFFLIMYVGIALGLRKYRLFDIDEWAYRILLWLGGIASIVTMDAMLLYFGLSQSVSLGVTLLVCGGLYFPFRQWLWQRLLNRRETGLDEILPKISSIAFIPQADKQHEAWRALLRKIYDPLELTQPAEEVTLAVLREDGLALQLPSCGPLPAQYLRYAGHGSRLFSSRDAQYANALYQLLNEVMSGRSSYEKGVAQERLRISRDLHDNIGARLLRLIHYLGGTSNAEVARDVMKDLRTSIAALDTQEIPITNALADWRAEAEDRCEMAACQLNWQQPEQLPVFLLSSRTKAMLESVIRELITNALKHAAPSNIDAAFEIREQSLLACISNDGKIGDQASWKPGYGLRNIRGRVEELGGTVNIVAAEGMVSVSLEVPLS